MDHLQTDWNLSVEPANGLRPIHPGLDGVRAIAFLMVFGLHAELAGFGGGFAGVDSFFVLSGFLIGGIVLDQLRSGDLRDREYLKRRAARILPCLAALLFVAGAVQIVADPAPWPRGVFWRSWLHGAAFTSNWHFFHGGDRSPLSHLWSLSTEVQFYLLFPLLLRLAWRWRILGWFFGGVAVLVLAQSVLLHWVFTAGHTGASNGLNAWVLNRPEGWLLGTVCAYLVRAMPMRRLSGVPVSLGIVVLASLSLWSRADWRVGIGCTSAQWATVLVLLLSVKLPGSGLIRALDWAPLRWVGRYSYGLYLWHFFVLKWVGKWGLPDWAWAPASFCLTLCFAVLTDRGGGRASRGIGSPSSDTLLAARQ